MPGESMQSFCTHMHVDKVLTHVKHNFPREEEMQAWIQKFGLKNFISVLKWGRTIEDILPIRFYLKRFWDDSCLLGTSQLSAQCAVCLTKAGAEPFERKLWKGFNRSIPTKCVHVIAVWRVFNITLLSSFKMYSLTHSVCLSTCLPGLAGYLENTYRGQRTMRWSQVLLPPGACQGWTSCHQPQQ